MAGGGQQASQSDNSMSVVWILSATFVGLGILWYSAKSYIVSIYFKIKLVEISIISCFTHNLDSVRNTMLTVPPDQFDLAEVIKLGQAVGDYVRYPLVLLLSGLAFAVYFTNTTRVFKRAYSMHTLVDAEKKTWPQIIPIADLDLIHKDIDVGPWAMATTPMQFCKRNKLLEEYKRQPQEGMTRKELARITVNLKRGQANKVFIMQLGQVWQGIDKLPMHAKALFAAFAARLNADSKPAMELLAQMSASSTTKLNFDGADALLKKHRDTKLVQKICQSHGYVLTLMASMLEGARQDGVQASSDFLWLKPLDRRLWYVLNTVGRQTPFVEVAGVFAHWIAEKEAGRKLLIPMVEEATNALDLAIKDIVYQRDE